MSKYEKYMELKHTLIILKCEKIQLESKISNIESEISNTIQDIKKEGGDMCPSCGEPLCPEDGRCYNSDCEEYDPLSQYFD